MPKLCILPVKLKSIESFDFGAKSPELLPPTTKIFPCEPNFRCGTDKGYRIKLFILNEQIRWPYSRKRKCGGQKHFVLKFFSIYFLSLATFQGFFSKVFYLEKNFLLQAATF